MHGWIEEEFGRSRRGIPLTVLLPGGRRPLHGLLVAALHGEEPETLQLARRLTERVGGDRTRWAVVPVANPDGVLAATRQNAAGVDLNRNFPARSWSAEPSFTYPPGTAVRRRPYRTSRSSPGAAPASEPEVQALVDLVERLDPPLVLDLHAPLAVIVPTPQAPPETVARLAAASGLPVFPSIGSPTPGALRDWCADAGRPCITYEVEHAPLPALYARHLPALAALLADGAPPAASGSPLAGADELLHRGRPVARVVGGDGSGAVRIEVVDDELAAVAARVAELARRAAAVPPTLSDEEADAALEEARAACAVTWWTFRDLRSGWTARLADGSERPIPGAVELHGDRAVWVP